MTFGNGNPTELVPVVIYQVVVIVLDAGGLLQCVPTFESVDQVALDDPRPSEHFRILNRNLPIDHVAFARQLFDDVHGVAVDRAVLAEPCLIHEISDIIEETEDSQGRASRIVELDPSQGRQGICGSGVDPKCIRNLYRIGDVSKVNGSQNLFTVGRTLKVDSTNAGHIGIAGFLDQYARYSDLIQFVNQQVREWKGVTFNWTSINSKFSCRPYELNLTPNRGIAGSKFTQRIFRSKP